MIQIEFYGANGYCIVCHQPLEGMACPYCGWEDKNPPRYGYIDMKNYQLGEATQLLEKVKTLTKALELIKNDSDDWRSRAIAIEALDEVIKIK